MIVYTNIVNLDENAKIITDTYELGGVTYWCDARLLWFNEAEQEWRQTLRTAIGDNERDAISQLLCFSDVNLGTVADNLNDQYQQYLKTADSAKYQRWLDASAR